MPVKSVWLVRIALAYFFAGATIGGALQLQKALPITSMSWIAGFVPAAVWTLQPLHVEFLLLGFMLHLAFGVALWILPKPATPRPEVLVWIAAALLNGGIWSVGLSAGVGPGNFAGALELAGRSAQIVAVVFFAAQVLPRVRSIESFRKN